MGDNQFAMVSEWMANRNINQFIKVHKDANWFKLVGFGSYYQPCPTLMTSARPLQLKGIVQGLMYMHSQGMIHGDLKGVGPKHYYHRPPSPDSNFCRQMS